MLGFCTIPTPCLKAFSTKGISTAEFKKFLYSFKDEGNFNTHVGMLEGMRGTFQFNRKGIEELYDIIGENKNLLFGVAEKPQYYSMFRLDIDRKIKGDEPRILFSDDDILNKVKEVQTLLRTTISKEFFKSDLLDCVLLEKAPYINEKQQISNGYHLQFPNLFLSKENIKKIITILREIDEEVDDITANPWLMYGASKNSLSGSYKASKVFTNDNFQIDPKDYFQNYKIYDMCENLIQFTKPVEYYYPRIFSINPNNRDVSELKPEEFKPKDTKQIKKISKIISKNIDINQIIKIAKNPDTKLLIYNF